jgi:hypothetical protein
MSAPADDGSRLVKALHDNQTADAAIVGRKTSAAKGGSSLHLASQSVDPDNQWQFLVEVAAETRLSLLRLVSG